MSRYRNYPDRLDLVICGECSTRTTLALIDRDEVTEHDEWHAAVSEAERLTVEWRAALAAKERNDTAQSDAAEQAAYDALVDHVEAHDLNHTEYDPR